MTAEKIIDSLKFTFKEADEQKDLFTPAHVLYKCRIINPENKRRYTFDYQCNPSATHEPEKKIVYIVFSPMPLVLIAAQMKPTFWKSSDILTAERIRLEKA